MCSPNSVLSPNQVEYKRGHDERISRFTTVADTPELLRAKAGGQLQSEVRNNGCLNAVVFTEDPSFFSYLAEEGGIKQKTAESHVGIRRNFLM